MTTLNEKQIEAAIAANALTLANALADAEIAPLLAAKGYPAGRLNEGLALIETARAKQEARHVTLGAQLAATDQFRAAFTAARTAYADLRETARAHFGSEAHNREIWQILGLGGAAPQTTDSFIGAAYATYDNALADSALVAALTPYGYDQTGLQAARATVEAMDAANRAQEQAKGASQRATAERDAAFSAQRTWVGKFRRIVRRAFKERPDLLVKLGL